MTKWQLQQAKTHLSKVIAQAKNEGPQVITRHGNEEAVLLSIENYRALVASQPDLKSLLLSGPKVDDLLIERNRDTGRKFKL